MADNDLKQHVSSSLDFYALLEVESHASEAEIRRAYRLTARKYHPDKVGASNKAALETFHNLQIAYGILSDESLKALYDNYRRAREEKKARESAFSDRRRAMVQELERREDAAAKRKRDEDLGAEERELRRMADETGQDVERLRQLQADGKRRRLELQARLQAERTLAQTAVQPKVAQQDEVETSEIPQIQRGVKLRYRNTDETKYLDSARLEAAFSQFGDVEQIILKEKRLKPPGAKHKEDYMTAWVIYKLPSSVRAAVSGFEGLQQSDESLRPIEDVERLLQQEETGHQGQTEVPKTSTKVQVEAGQIPKFSFNPKAKIAATRAAEDTG